ncbi:hypothetical protein Poli38472_005599 [Pythium oligandrum]|uniref:Cyclic nucleotide-binding domain-containing protein n=1 Tax=Pythium oligandrum TaxID=41045 RepID=A0A8K1CHP3_PYTOL|nr:hypothetical protein Poli38472_005599 [Pythium oligandrum]|eukprot:TMW62981.1 hypothetical protein Poli38472_005599 [Pythium oligandrum]
MAMMATAFEGSDAWIEAQRVHQRLKREQKALQRASTKIVVPFDREKFTEQVKDILDLDENAGFVIGLKRRRDFVTKLCEDYVHFTEAQKLELVLALAVDLGLQDLSLMVKSLPSLPRTHLVLNVLAAALGFSRKNEPNISKSIKRGLVPVPEQFFLLVGSVPLGPKFLLKLRVDLSYLLRKYAAELPKETVGALEYLDMVMRDLFAAQAGMRFRRIDMSSEKTVSFVLKHERVHAIRNWLDLKRRIAGPNRFSFGIFHLHMPYAPLVFVQVLVSDHLCAHIDPILNEDGPIIENPSHIIFYSISNANPGLRELNTASHLLFLTIERMSQLYPQCHTAATLSPVPGFGPWLRASLERPEYFRTFLTEQDTRRIWSRFSVHPSHLARWLLKRLSTRDWHLDAAFTETLRDSLVAACARYVLFERNGDKMLNSVANFHLQNGAQVEQVNFVADPSSDGIKSALGMMINYRYCMNSIDSTSVSYRSTCAAAASPATARLVWPHGHVILDEMDKFKQQRNMPLFARVYRAGQTICVRGTLPTDVYFICSGRIRVSSAHPYYLVEGAVYGHHELLNKEPVPYTLKAEVETHLIHLHKEDLEFLKRESSVLDEYARMDVRQRHQFEQERRTATHAVSRL